MELEGSLQHLQEPATCPYPKLAESSPWHLDDTFWCPPIYAWASQVVSFRQGLPTKILYTTFLSTVRATWPPISFFSILSPA
jgi:hypothetical protein